MAHFQPHDPSEVILICRFGAQETFISVEKVLLLYLLFSIQVKYLSKNITKLKLLNNSE